MGSMSALLPYFVPKLGTPAYYTASKGVQNQVYFKGHTARMLAARRRGGAYKRRRLNKIKRELKYVDVTGAAAIGATGTLIGLNNAIAEGTEYNQRVGRNIYACYIQYDIVIKSPTDPDKGDFGQVMFVLDRQANVSNPTTADILDATTAPIGMQFKKLSSGIDRFLILKTFKYLVTEGLPDSDVRYCGVQKIYLPKDRHITYPSSASGAPMTNQLVLLMTSNNATGIVATSASFVVSMRFAFVDA